jgi:hypothetical protein
VTGRQVTPAAGFLAASAATIAAAVVVLMTAHDHPRTEPPTASPTLARPPANHLSRPPRATVAHVARRFAVAYRDWDAGRRTRTAAALLRRLATRGLWRRLRRERARPTAPGPPRRLALQPVRAVASGDGTWRAAILARHPAGTHLATLVLAATVAGIRVVAVEN